MEDWLQGTNIMVEMHGGAKMFSLWWPGNRAQGSSSFLLWLPESPLGVAVGRR